MTTNAYKLVLRKTGRVCFVVFFSVSIPVLGAVLFATDRISGMVSFEHGWVFLIATPLACGAFLLGAWVAQMVDRRIGMRCPRCGRSLTFSCDPRKIVQSGACPGCHGSVFDLGSL
jgi:hypothetical protein